MAVTPRMDGDDDDGGGGRDFLTPTLVVPWTQSKVSHYRYSAS